MLSRLCPSRHDKRILQKSGDKQPKFYKMNSEPQNLPDLVVMNIFKYLTLPEICTAGRVCKKWYKLSRHPRFWKCVKFDSPKTTYLKGFIPHLLPYAEHIYCHYSFPCIFSVIELMNQLFDRCSTIEQLTIKGSTKLQTPSDLHKKIQTYDYSGRLAELDRLEKLERLDVLTFNPANVPILPLLARSRVLSTSQIQRPSNRLKMLSFRLFITNPQMLLFKELSFRIAFIDRTSRLFSSDFISLLPPKLEVLDLSNSYFPQLHGLLFRLRYLQELYIPQITTDDTPAVKLVILKFLKNIKILDLEGLHFETSSLVDLLKENMRLEKLYLKDCRGLQDTSLFNLIRHGVFTHLIEICIHTTSVTKVGIKELLNSCSSLRRIFVDAVQFRECRKTKIREKVVLIENYTGKFCDHFRINHPHNCRSYSEVSF